MKLELLSPAKNLEFGREAVNHGADALYIGAPAFGARAAASTISAMDAMLNPELPTSTTYAINHANGSNVSVSGQVANMLSTAQTVFKQSGGALDLTIYPVIQKYFAKGTNVGGVKE